MPSMRKCQAHFDFFRERTGASGGMLRCVQGHGGANERLKRLFNDLVALVNIDGAPSRNGRNDLIHSFIFGQRRLQFTEGPIVAREI
jgi:hypothetical protein